METGFDGQCAIVTGGARGIGAAIARELMLRRCKVAIWDLDLSGLAETLGQAPALAAIVDVADAASVEQAFALTLAEFGRIEVLINNAGINGPIGPMDDYPLAEWDRVIRVDLFSVFHCCRVAVPHMRATGYGRIVNIASIAGKEGSAGASAYSAAKAGVIGFSKAVARELAETGVTINCVAPAIAETDLFKQMTPAHIQTARGRIPMNRFARVEEIAAVAVFAASPACSFTSGFTFDASGGRATY
ncbi:MAG: SDR family NAD(P)-dependent oxidoreductase [Alsobacter sp.]